MKNNKEPQKGKQKSRLIFLLFSIFSLTLFLSSCAISNNFSVGDSRYLDLWWIEDLSDDAVLAVYAAEDNDNTVKIIKCGEHYAKWQRIKGNFTCVGYWTYETAESVIRTIPVVVKTSEYEKYEKKH